MHTERSEVFSTPLSNSNVPHPQAMTLRGKIFQRAEAMAEKALLGPASQNSLADGIHVTPLLLGQLYFSHVYSCLSHIVTLMYNVSSEVSPMKFKRYTPKDNAHKGSTFSCSETVQLFNHKIMTHEA